MSSIVKDLGIATAYGYAKSQGYTGTEEEFAVLMASYASVGQEAVESALKAEGFAVGTQDGETSPEYAENNAEYFKALTLALASQAASSASVASQEADSAEIDALKAEGWAIGEQNGASVPSSSPYYENNARWYASVAGGHASTATTKAGEASQSAENALRDAGTAGSMASVATADALKAEGYAVGKQNGVDVASGSPYYENNAKFYAEYAEDVKDSIPLDYTNLSNEVQDLKSAISVDEDIIGTGYRHPESYVNGSWSNSDSATPTLTTNNKRIRPNKFIPVYKDDILIVKNGSSFKHARAIWKGKLGSATVEYKDTSFITTDSTYIVENDGFAIVSFADVQDDTSVIDPSDFDGSVSVKTKIGLIEDVKQDLTYDVNPVDMMSGSIVISGYINTSSKSTVSIKKFIPVELGDEILIDVGNITVNNVVYHPTYYRIWGYTGMAQGNVKTTALLDSSINKPIKITDNTVKYIRASFTFKDSNNTTLDEVVPSSCLYSGLLKYYNNLNNTENIIRNFMNNSGVHVSLSCDVFRTANGIKFVGPGNIDIFNNNGYFKRIFVDSTGVEYQMGSSFGALIYSFDSEELYTRSMYKDVSTDFDPSGKLNGKTEAILFAFSKDGFIIDSSPLAQYFVNQKPSVVYSGKIIAAYGNLHVRLTSGNIYIANIRYAGDLITIRLANDVDVSYSSYNLIVYNISTNEISAKQRSELVDGMDICLLQSDANGKFVSGLLFDYIVDDEVFFVKGYIYWENGYKTTSDKRLCTNIYCFDHDVYVGFKRPVNDAEKWNFLTYRIYEYADTNNDQNVYVGAHRESEILPSSTRYNSFIPANTKFAIVVRYSNETVTGLYNQDQLLARIDQIFEVSRSPLYYDVPSYYLTSDQTYDGDTPVAVNYLDDKINVIDDYVRECDGNCDIFIRITDIHFDRNQQHSPALIKYIANKLNIPRMFNTGDDYDGTALNVYNIYKNAFDGDYYFSIGNHEIYGKASEYYTYGGVCSTHWMENDKAVFGNHRLGYYYVDNNADKIRYIVLNSMGEAEYDESTGQFVRYIIEPYDSDQMNWFNNVALNVSSGWSIIVFTHNVFSKASSDATYAMRVSNYGQRLINAIDAYDGNGIIAGVFCGDNHQDRIWYTPTNNIPVIVTLNDGIDSHQTTIDQTQKVAATIHEQAFDVVIMDKTNRVFHCVRIGAKAYDVIGISEDRGNLVEVRDISY